jgi:hypothetical protein
MQIKTGTDIVTCIVRIVFPLKLLLMLKVSSPLHEHIRVYTKQNLGPLF